ncbi:MAG: uroporphyrinogen decarboxylase family protein [Anaerolineae bacterium]
MNARERFLATMRFEKGVAAPKWEFGYWGATIKRWYREGLPERNYPTIPTRIVTTSSSLYTTAWTYEWRKQRTVFELSYAERQRRIELPDGIGVWGGALYWPSQGFPLDQDVTNYFGMDRSTVLVQVEQLFWPHFEPRVLFEDEKYVDYVDIDGITRRYQKVEGVIPTAMSWPIRDWRTWEEIKNERMRLDTIAQRFPPHWPELLQEYRNRDYPLAVGGYPLGLFGTLVHLLGYQNLFYSYYDQPDLLHDILQHLTRLWMAIWEEVMAQVDVDVVHIWEDMSSSRGSMISTATFREFMTPYYKRLTDFLKAHGVQVILVDTDGNCTQLIPLFLEAGITGLYPMEVSAGMDVLAARRQYPQLQMMGGIPKSELAKGRARIDAILEDVALLLRSGGYIPFGDHLIPPEVPWEHFKYYRERLNTLIERGGRA